MYTTAGNVKTRVTTGLSNMIRGAITGKSVHRAQVTPGTNAQASGSTLKNRTSSKVAPSVPRKKKC